MSERSTHAHSRIPGVLAVLLTMGALGAALLPYWIKIPQENMTIITQAQTTLWAGWLLMLGYYFGTTQSSKGKDDTITTLAKTAQTAGVALGAADTMTIPLDAQATVTPTDDGAVIKKDPA